jgi:serine protease AprX
MTVTKLVPPLVIAALVCAATFGPHKSRIVHQTRVSSDLVAFQMRRSTARVPVLVQGSDADLDALAARHKLPVVRYLPGAVVLLVNRAELAMLAIDGAADSISGDMRVRISMSVSNQSTGAMQVRTGTGGLLGLGGIPGVTGQGITIAVVDSGISSHAALSGKILANVSFVTGDTRVTDVYGHGTHVAGIIAGAATTTTPLYTSGIAPGARLVNVRVLGADGTGLTSDVIAGIEWVIANRTKYNIRVMNLSMGHPVTAPCAFDPLCQEIAKASAAGLVVVASAGNSGKAPDGSPILGGISSPGNSPYAITVGALNTWQTVGRSDDSVTTYSSRGPTKYDLAVKPDIVAPGNKIVSLEANGSALSTTYTFLHVAGSGNSAYMRLSGTSMAAPMVSGAVALLLQGSSNLSAAQLKLALQMGATFLPNAGLQGGGAGSVNFWTSRQTTANGLTWLLGQITGLLTGPSGAAYWDAGTMSERLYSGGGLRLISALEAPLVWLNPSILQWGDLNLLGVTNPLAAIPANNLLWGEVATWTTDDHILWGDQIDDPQGNHILWGDSFYTDDNHILWGDAVVTSSDPH